MIRLFPGVDMALQPLAPTEGQTLCGCSCMLMAMCGAFGASLILAEAGVCPGFRDLSGHSHMGTQTESTAQPSPPPSSHLGVIKGWCLQHWL